MRLLPGLVLAAALLLAGPAPRAASPQSAPPAPPAEDGMVIASGTVPDEAARAQIIARLGELFGAGRVLDRLEVGGVVPPPNWSAHITRAMARGVTEIRAGELQVVGTRLTVSGKVANELLRQQIVSEMAGALNPTYTVSNGLTVAPSAQNVLDDTLGERVVEFEVGSTTLTVEGVRILDEMAAAIRRVDPPAVQIIGHTDSTGERLANIDLSLRRAAAVRDYLAARGVAAERLSALGAGPDQPVASNDSAEGRAKNRRIEFHIRQ